MTFAVKPRKKNSVDPFFNLVDEFFPFSPAAHKSVRPTTVLTNVLELDDQFVIEMAVPGFEKNDFEIAVENDTLKIRLNVTDDAPKGTYRRREFKYGNIDRSWNLGKEIDQDKIEANYLNGILQVSLGKKDEAKTPAPKSIEIS